MTCLRSHSESEPVGAKTQVFDLPAPNRGTGLAWAGGPVKLHLGPEVGLHFAFTTRAHL